MFHTHIFSHTLYTHFRNDGVYLCMFFLLFNLDLVIMEFQRLFPIDNSKKYYEEKKIKLLTKSEIVFYLTSTKAFIKNKVSCFLGEYYKIA